MTTELELSSLPIIDWDAAIKTAGNKKEVAEELLNFLCKTLRDDVKAIHQAFADNQFKELLQRVHKLHGGVSYCGLPRLKKLLMAMETNIKKNDVADFHSLLHQLEVETERLLSEQAKVDSFHNH